MTDNLTKEQRRKNMQNIRSEGTLPERIIMAELRHKKIYFASHVKTVIGKPDIVFRKKRVVVFVDSDFWHGHPKRSVQPKTNKHYWKRKIESNKKRDKIVNKELRKAGWKVVRLWEYQIKKNPERSVKKVLGAISK